MKKLIYKSTFFVGPFFLLYLIYFGFYNTKKGDLLRIGYIADIYNYNSKELFKKEIQGKINFTLFSKINLKSENYFSVFTIGDSFSELGAESYQNYLADNSKIKVLHLDRFLHENPIETVNGFLNGGTFDNIKVDYIILQSVERSFVIRGMNLNTKAITSISSLSESIKKHRKKSLVVNSEPKKDEFFSQKTIKFSLDNLINYNLDDNANDLKVYKVKTKKILFTKNINKLLFLEDDLLILEINNVKKNIDKLNYELNFIAERLKLKGIKLIVLPCPDKLDFYYDDISNNNKYPKPIFFDYLNQLEKKYIYVDSKKILKDKTKNVTDIYFFDDTHWSPIAAKIIAKKLNEIIVSDSINLK